MTHQPTTLSRFLICTFFLSATALTLQAQSTAVYFRVMAPVAATLTRIDGTGALSWTNPVPNTTCDIQIATTLAGGGNWRDHAHVVVTSAVTSAKVFNRTQPSGMAFIPAGVFKMGDSTNDHPAGTYRELEETPVHPIQLDAFNISKHEITKAEWDTVVSWAVSHGYTFDCVGNGKSPNHPVAAVCWYDVVRWCNARSEKEGLTPCYYTDAAQTVVFRTGVSALSNAWVKWSASGFRLPTEAEWEYAARGGRQDTRFDSGSSITHTQANYYSTNTISYDVSSTKGFHPDHDDVTPCTAATGTFPPNHYGLHEIAGNVSEWCWDRSDGACSPCTPCGGDGLIPCPTCTGAGNITCSTCSGAGVVSCVTCEGDGSIPAMCNNCGGIGSNTCTSCMGIKTIDITCTRCSGNCDVPCTRCNEGSVTCGNCSGNGRLNCPPCGATGYVTCPNCNGAGGFDCGYCDGSGCDQCTNGRNECTTCFGSGNDICSSCGGTQDIECNTCTGLGTVFCPVCGGSSLVSCPTCYGQGYRTVACTTCGAKGSLSCNPCRGTGTISTNCTTCSTSGMVTCASCKGVKTLTCPSCNGVKTATCISCTGQGDIWTSDYYTHAAVLNPRGPTEGEKRIFRGGAWDSTAEQCRLSHRSDAIATEANASRGFRTVRAATE